MKIYNEVTIDMNPESSTYEQHLSEDSIEYNGDLALCRIDNDYKWKYKDTYTNPQTGVKVERFRRYKKNAKTGWKWETTNRSGGPWEYRYFNPDGTSATKNTSESAFNTFKGYSEFGKAGLDESKIAGQEFQPGGLGGGRNIDEIADLVHKFGGAQGFREKMDLLWSGEGYKAPYTEEGDYKEGWQDFLNFTAGIDSWLEESSGDYKGKEHMWSFLNRPGQDTWINALGDRAKEYDRLSDVGSRGLQTDLTQLEDTGKGNIRDVSQEYYSGPIKSGKIQNILTDIYGVMEEQGNILKEGAYEDQAQNYEDLFASHYEELLSQYTD